MREKIANVTIGKRHRKDFGDLEALASSIAELGLLQPIGIDPNGKLVYGERRLRACRDILGLNEIDATVVDIGKVVQMEHDENEIRKDFTASERVAISQAVKDEIGNRRGRRTDKLRKKISEVGDYDLPKGMKTEEFAAKRAGFGNVTTYRQARTVVEKGAPELVEAMDNNVVSISAAAKLARQPHEEQRKAVADPAYFDKVIRESKAAIEATKTEPVRIMEVVDAFEDIANSKLSPHEFRAKCYPASMRRVEASLPRVREFIAAIEGGARGSLKAV